MPHFEWSLLSHIFSFKFLIYPGKSSNLKPKIYDKIASSKYSIINSRTKIIVS